MISLFVFLLLCGVCLLMYGQVKIDFLSKKIFLISFLIKLIYGFIFIFIYKYWIGNGVLSGDVSDFFNDAKVISLIASESPLNYIKVLFGFIDDTSPEIWEFVKHTNVWEYIGLNELLNDNRLIIKFNSVIHLFSNNNVYVHSMVHSFLSFTGIMLIYLAFKDLVENKKMFWIILIILPSISFWGTSILKESLMIFSIGLFCFGWYNFYKNKYLVSSFILFLSVLLLVFNKPYVGIVIVPISLLFMIGYLFNWSVMVAKITLTSVLIGFVLIIIIPNRLNVINRLSFRQQEMIDLSKGGVVFLNDSAFCKFDYDFINNFEKVNDSLIKINSDTQGQYKLFGTKEYKNYKFESNTLACLNYSSNPPSNSYFESQIIGNSKLNLLKSVPLTLVNVLIRPFPWDNGGSLKIFSFLQNILIFMFIVISIFKRRSLRDIEKWVLLILTLSSLFIILLIGWTTPIFGTIIRYKIPVDLFLIIIGFIMLKSKQHGKI